MASAVMAKTRSFAVRSSTLLKTLAPKPIPTSPSSIPRAASRVCAALGSVESLMPLHSAIASARLRSCIAVDSTCWSLLSQGFATPL